MSRYVHSLTFMLLACICMANLAMASVGDGGGSTYESWGRFPGAEIINKATADENNKTKTGDPLGSCNPDANPANDAAKTNNFEKSCIGQNITRNNFTVMVRFDPKQPDNLVVTPPTRNIPGPATLPKDSSGSDLTSVWTEPRLEEILPSTVPKTYRNSNSQITDLGDKCVTKFICIETKQVRLASNRAPIYGPPVAIKHPVSGNVKTASTGTPASIPAAGATIPTQVDMVYTSTTNTRAVPAYTIGAVSIPAVAVGSLNCTLGGPQTYRPNIPIRTAACEIALDNGKCKNLNPSFNPATDICNIPLLGGADRYDENGNLMLQAGAPIIAVAGPSIEIPNTTNLYHSVFTQIPEEEIKRVAAKEFTLKVDSDYIPIPNMQAHFQTRIEGGHLCVYARVDADKEWRVETKYPKTLNQIYDETDASKTIYYRDATHNNKPTVPKQYNNPLSGHCVRVPAPTPPPVALNWNTLISDVCWDASNAASRFRWPSGGARSFTGVTVECIEDTMANLFFPKKPPVVKDGATPPPVSPDTFFQVLQSRVKTAIMALMSLYIIFFGYKLMMGTEVPKRNEWAWLMLKLALVSYFAIGSGMVDLLPTIRGITTNLSAIVMDAGTDGVAKSPEWMLYSYCDFSDKTKYVYPAGKEHIRMFDMIDCKISKYLGIGDNYSLQDAPQLILIALLAPISVPLGIPIFFLSFMVLISIISVVIHIVHIYIMSIMAVMMLVYISPIVIPSVFFEATKSIFAQWMTQVIGYAIQPIILFGFLSFMMAITDGAIFGGNHAFDKTDSPAMYLVNNNGRITPDNNSCATGSSDKCSDQTSLAYILQTADISRNSWPGGFLDVFAIWHVDFNGNDIALVVGLSKLLLIAFVVSCLLQTIEELSGRIVALGGNGAASFAAAPAISPAQAMQLTASAVAAGKDALYNAPGAIAKTAGGVASVTRGIAYVATLGRSERLIPGSDYNKKKDAEASKNRETAKKAEAAGAALKELAAAAAPAAAAASGTPTQANGGAPAVPPRPDAGALAAALGAASGAPSAPPLPPKPGEAGAAPADKPSAPPVPPRPGAADKAATGIPSAPPLPGASGELAKEGVLRVTDADQKAYEERSKAAAAVTNAELDSQIKAERATLSPESLKSVDESMAKINGDTPPKDGESPTG